MQTCRLALPEREPQLDKRLREINFGQFEGATREELSADLRDEFDSWWKDPFGQRAPDGESMTDLSDRIEAWVNDLPAQGRFAVVTHGGVIRCVLWTITGAPAQGRWSMQLDNTSITKVRAKPSRTIILCVNDNSHLS